MSFLNQGQQAAAEGFFNFLFNNEQDELIISGAGGVGKTFLMGYLIDEVMPRYHETCNLLGIDPIYQAVEMTATTNKAAEVLERATGRPTGTIHSFLKLRIIENYKTGVSRLEKTPNWTVHQNLILFVDECSMIDSPLYRHLQEGTHNCKIIYVGDHSQLAPVMEPISPIYRANLPFYELTEPMRNSGQPALLEVCAQLRETVKSGVFLPIKAVPGVIDHLSGPEMEAEIETHFKDTDNNNKILAYTNNRVLDYNAHIRDLRGLPANYFVAGERVINNTNITLNRLSIPVEAQFTIVNTEEHPTLVSVGYGADQAELEVITCSIHGPRGLFHNVKVPVNRDHYNSLIKYFAKKKNWPVYYSLKNEFADLRLRDASTVHKAQGSTYDTVFIDLDDLSRCHNPSVAARLLYVAFTRAQKRVVLYGRLAQKYGGVIET